MSLMSTLESAQGGMLFASVAKAVGLSQDQAKSAMGALCPAIAAQLKAKAERDTDTYDTLLDLLEDNEAGSGLDDPGALTDAEAVNDGNAVLADIYGSTEDALAKLGRAAADVAAAKLPQLAAISATAVLAVIAQGQNAPQALTGAQPAMGSGGIMGTIVESLVKGLVQGGARSLAPKRRRRRSYGSYYTRRRSKRRPTRRRTHRTPLEEIFRGILGTR